jgi:four helix bundle protein
MISRKVESFHDLVVWQKSHELVLELFKAKLSKKETESLASNIRSIATAIPTNISIGFKKRGKKPKLYYYRAALNSIQEISYLLLLANDLKLLKTYSELDDKVEDIERMLKRLIRSNSPTA